MLLKSSVTPPQNILQAGPTDSSLAIVQHASFTSDLIEKLKLEQVKSITNSPSLGIVIQARMGSTRLPGKVAINVNGKEYLSHQIDRVLTKSPRNRCVIATTVETIDDIVCDIALKSGIGYFRGDTEDVLDRYIGAAEMYGFTDVVRLTGDCPLIDPYIMDAIINVYNTSEDETKFVSNTLFRTFPRGFDVEVTSVKNLKTAWNSSRNRGDREHVTPYVRSGCIRGCKFINCSFCEDFSRWRFTLDTFKDHLQLSQILTRIDGFQMTDVIDFAVTNNLLQLDNG